MNEIAAGIVYLLVSAYGQAAFTESLNQAGAQGYQPFAGSSVTMECMSRYSQGPEDDNCRYALLVAKFK